MTYDNITHYISKTIIKTIFLWTTIFCIAMGLFFFYQHENKKNIFLQEQLTKFAEIHSQITLAIHNSAQKNKNAVVSYDQSKIHIWMKENHLRYSAMVRDSSLELDLLEKLGKNFFALRAYSETQISLFEELSTHIELLKRLTFKQIINSPLNHPLINIIFPVSLGILILLIVISLIFSHQLQRSILHKNEIILDDIWHELQSIEQNTESLPEDACKTDCVLTNPLAPIKHSVHEILEDTNTLFLQTNMVRESLLICCNKLEPLTLEKVNDATSRETPELKEKTVYIQKLLSQLFTRSERASSLAKAATDNGFQAGILALNISIEAARSGESGRSFLSASDRVKDFAEKSSHIGDAILDELKDVNLSIRKAYAIGKSMIDGFSSLKEPLSSTTPLYSANELQQVKMAFDHITEITDNIQTKIRELSNSLAQPPINIKKDIDPIQKRTNEIMKDLMVRSFERLYTLNYGVEPPDLSSETNQ